MRFFRGIAVSSDAAESTIEDIRSVGLLGSEGTWRMTMFSHRGSIDDLFSKNDLSTEDTRVRYQEEQAICACGEVVGAAYYALKHNRTKENNTPIILEFEVDEKSVAVDGRDFLYVSFQIGNPIRARPVLQTAFGEAVLPYADLAWKQKSQDKRIALCDLAVRDPAVIRAHHDNVLVLGGRHGTIFRNAFLVTTPIPVSALICVRRLDSDTRIPRPEVTLTDLRIE